MTKYPQLNISQGTLRSLEKIAEQNEKEIKRAVVDTLRSFDTLAIAYNKEGKCSPKCEAMQKAYLKYCKKNGIPSMELYGEPVYLSLIKIENKDILKQYKDLLYKEMTKGNIYPYFYATLVDRHAGDGPVTYNSYYSTGLAKEELEKINKSRKDIGLSTYFKGPGTKPITNFNVQYIKVLEQ
jgi:hypothetical protein